MSQLLIYIFFLHFIADFPLQPRWMGAGKSSNDKILLQHLAIQFAVIFAGLVPYMYHQYSLAGSDYPTWVIACAAFLSSFKFSFCNALIHGIIDRHIWRGYKLYAGYKIKRQLIDEVNKTYNSKFETDEQINAEVLNRAKSFKFWEDGMFFDTIGLDQFLHGATLIALAGWLL